MPFVRRSILYTAGRVDCTATDVVYCCFGILIEGDRPVGKVTYVVAAAMAALFCLSGDALADEMTVKRHARKAVVHTLQRRAPRLSRSVLVLTRCTALMGPMAAMRIGPGIRTLAGIDRPLPARRG